VFTSVVVPLDGSPRSETALVAARAVTDRLGARLVLVTSALADDTDECETYLAEVTERLGGPAVGVVVADREPAAAITEALEDQERPLVCMATHGRTGIGRALLGSVAERVVAVVDAPVLLTGPQVDTAQPVGPDVVVVTLDGSELAASIVPVASELAEGLGVGVEVVTVAEVPVGPDTGYLAREVTDGAAGAGVPDPVDLEPAIARFRAAGVGATGVHLIGDDAARAVVDHVGGRRAFVCMASHGRGGLRRVTLGSVAAKVVHRSTCPVLVSRAALPMDTP
jgi:nucleotide-binding universal stress UspA family protein